MRALHPVLFLLALTSCGEGRETDAGDAGSVDAAHDAEPEASPDAAADAEPEAPNDSGPIDDCDELPGEPYVVLTERMAGVNREIWGDLRSPE